MKVLNIDAIAPTSGRSIRMNGQTHPIVEMSVENFVTTTKEAERLAKDDAPLTEQIAATADAILRSVPTLDHQTVYDMSLARLGVIYRFISGEAEFNDYPDAVTDEEDKKK